MKLLSCVLSLILAYLFLASPVNAQSLTPTQSPQENTLTEPQASGNGVLNSFFQDLIGFLAVLFLTLHHYWVKQ